MGEWKKARNVKWGSETERKVIELSDALWPYCSNEDGSFNRSATVRFVVEMFHRIVFTPDILQKLGDVFQGLHMAHSVRTLEVPSPGKPGPMRVGLARDQEDRNARRAGANSTSYRLAARAESAAIPAGRRSASGITSSLLRFRSSFASRVA